MSPFELATVAYCFLGIVIYGFWWFKQRYGCPNYSAFALRSRQSTGGATQCYTFRWMDAPPRTSQGRTHLTYSLDAMKTLFLSEDGEDFELLKEMPVETPSWIIHIAVILFGLTSLSYFGIHIAA